MREASFVTCVNHYDIYTANVIKSTEAYADRIDYIVIESPASGSLGLNEGIRKAKEDIIVCCHQDIFFLDNWLDKMFAQLDMLPKWGACGCAGAMDNGQMVGCHSGLGMREEAIAVQTLDGSLIILDKQNNLLFDENLRYFHMYDVDIALQANDKGLGAYVIYAPIIHNTKWTSGSGFGESGDYIKQKWNYKVGTVYTTVGRF